MSSNLLSINSDEHNRTTFSWKGTLNEDEVCSSFSHTFCRCHVGPSAHEQACQAGASCQATDAS